MKARPWFLPEGPDVLTRLRTQVAIAIEGLDALARWARGDSEAGAAVTDAAHRGDTAKRELLVALRAAIVTPLEPEDVFALSRSIDHIVRAAHEVVVESQVLASPPGDEVAEMATLIGKAMRHIDEAIAQLGPDAEAATKAADAALGAERLVAHLYYHGMASLLEVEDMRERISRRELYRRCARIGEGVVDVAERIQYAIVKQS